MSADEFLKVQRIGRDIWLPWVTFRHYARREPNIVQDAFGLFRDNDCIGVVTYSHPSSPKIAQSVVAERWRSEVVELSRLAVGADAPANSAGFLVAHSLRLLASPRIVVSYADAGLGHVGYVYQATSFDYCGTGPEARYVRLSSGELIHPRSLTASNVATAPVEWAISNGHTIKIVPGKHRYLKVVGSPRQRRAIYRDIRWQREDYPKGDSARQVVADFHPTQSAMF
jgi:hypothetical protein